jgi:hypothetical protein
MTLTSTDETPERRRWGEMDESKVDGIFSSKTQSEPSDSQIQWVDPQELIEREKLAAKLSAETQAPKFVTVSTETEEVTNIVFQNFDQFLSFLLTKFNIMIHKLIVSHA